MEKIIYGILGFLGVGLVYLLGRMRNGSFKNPLESDKKYIERRMEKHAKELDKKSDDDIINMLDNADDIQSTIANGRRRMEDLLHTRGVRKPKKRTK